jgi:hypothetical protein
MIKTARPVLASAVFHCSFPVPIRAIRCLIGLPFCRFLRSAFSGGFAVTCGFPVDGSDAHREGEQWDNNTFFHSLILCVSCCVRDLPKTDQLPGQWLRANDVNITDVKKNRTQPKAFSAGKTFDTATHAPAISIPIPDSQRQASHPLPGNSLESQNL